MRFLHLCFCFPSPHWFKEGVAQLEKGDIMFIHAPLGASRPDDGCGVVGVAVNQICPDEAYQFLTVEQLINNQRFFFFPGL